MPAGATAPSERIFTWPLRVAVVVIGGTLLSALDDRWHQPGLAESVQRLCDGDLDGRARQACLARLQTLALSASGRREHVLAALVAVERGDEPGLASAFARLGPEKLPIQPGDAAYGAAVDLDLPHLRSLLRGWASEAAMDRDAARVAYQQAAVQGRLWNRPLVQRLAGSGLQRL